MVRDDAKRIDIPCAVRLCGGKPSGDPFRVTNFENPSERVYSPMNTMELALTPDRMILPIVEASGAVWVLDNIER